MAKVGAYSSIYCAVAATMRCSIWQDGEDLRGLPLIERKRRLRRLIRASRNQSLLYADHVEAYGAKFFGAICQRDCEGIVAKHRHATYGVLGPAGWFKVLNPAYTQKRGRREMFEGFRKPAETPASQASASK